MAARKPPEPPLLARAAGAADEKRAADVTKQSRDDILENRVRPRFLPLLAIACSTAACSSDQHPGGSGGAAGSASSTLDVRPFVWSTDGAVPIVAGGTIELWSAPQGGHVSRIGAEISGLETDTAELVARLRDPVSGDVIVESSRTAPMVPVPGEPGVKQPDPSSMYNVVHLPLCPDNDGRAIDGQPFLLEVRATELYADFSEGSATLEVTPACSSEDPSSGYCGCECGADYAPAKCAGDAGGVPDSGTP